MADMAWRSLRATSKLIVRRRLNLRVEGIEFLPARGPAIIAARHFHHLYDGCALLAEVPRPLHILVALDWVGNRPGRLLMESACRAARWPVVLRRDSATSIPDGRAARALRRATREAMALLEAGRIVLVFPEGYPNVDPGYTPKPDEAAFLPFQPGFVRLATLASARGLRVPIVPVGFSYRRGSRWQVDLRFGEPLTIESRVREGAVLREIETRVYRLSCGTERGHDSHEQSDKSRKEDLS
jgi:1-acyl-sn-glycerol-3-phosphate acyltransferase